MCTRAVPFSTSLCSPCPTDSEKAREVSQSEPEVPVRLGHANFQAMPSPPRRELKELPVCTNNRGLVDPVKVKTGKGCTCVQKCVRADRATNLLLSHKVGVVALQASAFLLPGRCTPPYQPHHHTQRHSISGTPRRQPAAELSPGAGEKRHRSTKKQRSKNGRQETTPNTRARAFQPVTCPRREWIQN